MKKIDVYAINLNRRVDRNLHIRQQFMDKREFNMTIVPAIENPCGASGLHQTIRNIVKTENAKQSDFFIICEDDHYFLEDYCFEYLIKNIQQAQYLSADILSGGVSWFDHCLQINDNLFWINKFNGMQFTVFFNKFYKEFIKEDSCSHPIVDFNISEIAKNKFVTYPYISRQKEFGYSDVTSRNAQEGYVDSIFEMSMNRLNTLSKVRDFYKKEQYKSINSNNE